MPLLAATGSLWLAGSSRMWIDGLPAILVGGKGGEKVVLAKALRSGRLWGAPRAMSASAASRTLSVRLRAVVGNREVVPATGDPRLLGSFLARLDET